MNTFAGNITLKGNKTIIGQLEFDYVENLSKDGNKVLYIFGDTDIETSTDFIAMLKELFGEILNYDISLSSEDKMSILGDSYEEGVYELATFEGEQVDFDEILDRFSDFDGVISIREAENSSRFGNKVVKVDFVY
ncbi:MAG: hypothetical protein Q8K30_06855 [Candidatus Gracilibacteria bacterium]|nr:hypothetical protein [Candidatus Gracilibacteria bacterium]